MEQASKPLGEMVAAVQQARAEGIERLNRQLGLSQSALAEASPWVSPFEAFDTAWHPDAARAQAAAREWVYGVSSGRRLALVLWAKANEKTGQSGYGTGKTLLAKMATECLAVMRNHLGQQQAVEMVNAADLFQAIKDSYSADTSTDSLFRRWTRGHLILDDWGKQYTTASGELWAREQFYRIINRIYEAGRGLMLTSNHAPGDIEAAIGGASWSRLMGMAGPGGFVDMSAVPDYRLKEGGFVG